MRLWSVVAEWSGAWNSSSDGKVIRVCVLTLFMTLVRDEKFQTLTWIQTFKVSLVKKISCVFGAACIAHGGLDTSRQSLEPKPKVSFDKGPWSECTLYISIIKLFGWFFFIYPLLELKQDVSLMPDNTKQTS